MTIADELASELDHPAQLPRKRGGRASVSEPLHDGWRPGRRARIAAALGLCLAWGFGAVFLYLCWLQFVPAHPGVDQNGYFVGGKQLAATGTMKLVPRNPYEFVGRMWVGIDLDTPTERFYPKYPAGLPAIFAILLRLDPVRGIDWSYWVSPVCAALALVGMYHLTRLVAGAFVSVLAMLALAGSAVTLQLAMNPNSHAPCLAFVIWGMYLVARGLGFSAAQPTEPTWRGIIVACAGAWLCGFAVSIRYTEFLLCLPIGWMLLAGHSWRSRTSWLKLLAVTGAFSLPVLVLLAYNRASMGAWTGYDPTNESTGFAMSYFAANWSNMLRQLYSNGLFFLLPVCVLGLVMMLAGRNARQGIMLLLWALPGILLYTGYYWAPERGGLGYARFFLTFFPPLLVAGAWFFDELAMRMTGSERTAGRGVAAVACGVLVAVSVGVGAVASVGEMERSHRSNLNLWELGNRVRAAAKTAHDTGPAVVFAAEERGGGFRGQVLNYLQYAARLELYSSEMFSGGEMGGPGMMRDDDPDAPNPWQAARREQLARLRAGKTSEQLLAEAREIAVQALTTGRRVLILAPSRQATTFRNRHFPPVQFETRLIDSWTDPAEMPVEAVGGPGMGGPGMQGPPGGRREPQRQGGRQARTNWQLIEVRLKPPSATSGPTLADDPQQ
jgi:hypothetical protein